MTRRSISLKRMSMPRPGTVLTPASGDWEGLAEPPPVLDPVVIEKVLREHAGGGATGASTAGPSISPSKSGRRSRRGSVSSEHSYRASMRETLEQQQAYQELQQQQRRRKESAGSVADSVRSMDTRTSSMSAILGDEPALTKSPAIAATGGDAAMTGAVPDLPALPMTASDAAATAARNASALADMKAIMANAAPVPPVLAPMPRPIARRSIPPLQPPARSSSLSSLPNTPTTPSPTLRSPAPLPSPVLARSGTLPRSPTERVPTATAEMLEVEQDMSRTGRRLSPLGYNTVLSASPSSIRSASSADLPRSSSKEARATNIVASTLAQKPLSPLPASPTAASPRSPADKPRRLERPVSHLSVAVAAANAAQLSTSPGAPVSPVLPSPAGSPVRASPPTSRRSTGASRPKSMDASALNRPSPLSHSFTSGDALPVPVPGSVPTSPRSPLSPGHPSRSTSSPSSTPGMRTPTGSRTPTGNRTPRRTTDWSMASMLDTNAVNEQLRSRTHRAFVEPPTYASAPGALVLPRNVSKLVNAPRSSSPLSGNPRRRSQLDPLTTTQSPTSPTFTSESRPTASIAE
ncbi:hypothetical protein THASP1DRAFT_33264 [Thamnocephalis sphaerospora]|uniref:Uncharacterized protein n=1 Tax=Thamnocephalis sphaerospora TaxID=78915 RepID=A0A4P9XGY6_9FUNG|nr:hypothetical protein THASP1DRAFT_33264 [Thamnocephalis sphaerospora]|eukprot:RKP04913.1 hypothetical protein THASP1DRAFT_33264 [Thamnocephalis sphaerospora]